MTHVTLRMPTKRMKIKTMVNLLDSVIILAGSPAVASPIAHDGFHCRISEQRWARFVFSHSGRASRPRSMRRTGTAGINTHDDWPANITHGVTSDHAKRQARNIEVPRSGSRLIFAIAAPTGAIGFRSDEFEMEILRASSASEFSTAKTQSGPSIATAE